MNFRRIDSKPEPIEIHDLDTSTELYKCRLETKCGCTRLTFIRDVSEYIEIGLTPTSIPNAYRDGYDYGTPVEIRRPSHTRRFRRSAVEKVPNLNMQRMEYIIVYKEV